jgi:hypothetical protein
LIHVFSLKERDGKQLARVDEDFRSKERVKERDAKQLAREDEDFRIQETAKDLQRKRGQRSNPHHILLLFPYF